MSQFILIFAMLLAEISFSKGLDDIEAENPANQEDTLEQEDGQAKVPQDAKKPEAAASAVAPAPIVRSEISKKLDERMILSVGMYRVAAKLSEGEWQSNGMADFMVAIDPKLIASSSFSLFLDARYSAINASAKVDGRSYATIIEGYGFGVLGIHKTWTSFSLVGSVEPTLYRVSYRPTDNLDTEETTKQTKMSGVLGLGGDYTGREKLRVGPRVMVGVGAVSSVQVGVNGSFVF